MKSAETLKKLYLINSVFAGITGNDLYFAEQIRLAVEAALDDNTDVDAGDDFERFRRAVVALRNTLPADGTAFHCWDAGARKDGFSPLWARAELIAILKAMAAEPRATLLIANLADAVRPRSGRWTRKARDDYSEAVAFIRELALRWSTPSARRTLIVC